MERNRCFAQHAAEGVSRAAHETFFTVREKKIARVENFLFGTFLVFAVRGKKLFWTYRRNLLSNGFRACNPKQSPQKNASGGALRGSLRGSYTPAARVGRNTPLAACFTLRAARTRPRSPNNKQFSD